MILAAANLLGKVFKWDEDRQGDHGSPTIGLPDGRLGNVQRTDDFSPHLEDLFSLFPGNVGIELDYGLELEFDICNF